jgi:dTDP-4-amino-4,6-dideoxygalactose transaminase
MKSQLAINGGLKEISYEYRVFKHPIIDKDISSAVVRQLNTDISLYDNGGIYSLLENKLKEVFNLKNILTTNSGTTALFSLFYGYDFEIDDNVIVPSYTFFATAAPLINLGVQLKFADCLLDNGNIDPEKIKEKIDTKTKAIIITHMWGIPCDMDEILKIGVEYGIPVLEDASHAHLAEYNGKIIGSFSDGAAWSLQGKKNLTAGEGGMLTSKNKRVMERAVIAGHFNKRAKLEVYEPDLIPYAVTGSGYNFRMHPLGAAIAFHLLKQLENQTKDRREVANYIASRINQIEGLSNPRIPRGSKPAWYAYPILFCKNYFNDISIHEFVKAINAEGAVEADVPGATGSMGRYKLFNDPSGISKTYLMHKYASPDSIDFHNADLFHSSMFKIPTWYGEKRFEYANAYLNAIEKVAKNFKYIAK